VLRTGEAAALAVLVGVLAAPLLRAWIFRFAVPSGSEWRCPRCGAGVALLPSGRCRCCALPLGPPAGLVEALAAVVLAALVLGAGAVSPSAPVVFALCWVALVGITLAFVDIAAHRLPDPLTLTLLLGALAALTGTGDWPRLGRAVACGLAAGAVYLLLVLVAPAGMGVGDAKLAVGLGVVLGWFGWTAVVLGIAAGFVLAGLVGVVLLALRRVGRKDPLPHGPFMLLGALLSVLLATGGDQSLAPMLPLASIKDLWVWFDL
jgi:leader peptidase (prepilin peptidase) / N-methyltransferase